jgi:hypothetical protein
MKVAFAFVFMISMKATVAYLLCSPNKVVIDGSETEVP